MNIREQIKYSGDLREMKEVARELLTVVEAAQAASLAWEEVDFIDRLHDMNLLLIDLDVNRREQE